MAWVGKVVYDFQATSLEEIDLRKGDIVRVHPAAPSQVLSKHWLYATVHGRGTGLVPASCVSQIAPPPILASYEEGDLLYIAGEGFAAQDPSQDLSFSKGEFLIGRIKLSDHWTFGYSADGSRSGRFPLALVLSAGESETETQTQQGHSASVAPSVVSSSKPVSGQAVVVENAVGQLPGELSVQKGDGVHVLGADGDHWLRCRLENGTVGLVSRQVVRFFDEPKTPENPSQAILQYGIVLHDFRAEFENELACRAGEQVAVLEFVDSDWVRARSASNGREGLVPLSFVEVEHEKPEVAADRAAHSEIPAKVSLYSRRLKALYDFQPESAGDLRLKAGIALEFLEYCEDENWIRARDLTTGEIGVCPSAYVSEDSPVSPPVNFVHRDAEKKEPVKQFSSSDFLFAAASKPAGGVANVDSRIEKNLMGLEISARVPYVSTNVPSMGSSTTFADAASKPSSTSVDLMDVDFSAEANDSKYDTLDGLFAGHDKNQSSSSNPKPDISSGSVNRAEESVRRTLPPRPVAPSQAVVKVRPVIPPRPPVAKKVEKLEESTPETTGDHPYPMLTMDTIDEGNGGSFVGNDSPKSVRSTKSSLSLAESEDSGDVGSIGGNQPMEKREYVVKEILSAERDYIRHLKTAVEVFGLNDAPVLEEHGMDSKAVFGNIQQIIDVAERLEASLAATIEGVDPSDQRIGACFLQLKNELEEAYLKYCLHYSKTSGVLVRYTSIPKDKELLDALAYNIRSRGVPCLNVDTILIEPVQHVLKYHLLLSELIRASDQNHDDMVDLWEAHRVALERNKKINETGRVTDLLEKYSKTKSSRMSHVSMRSISKGAGRIATSVAASLGLSSETKCEVFDERAKRFKDVDDCIKAFKKWVCKFAAEFAAVLKLELSLCDSLSRLFEGDGKPQEVDRFWSVHYAIYSELWPKYESQLNVQVSSPLGVLSDTLERPRFLIEKRRNKLLDYDKLRNKMARVRDSTVQMRDELDTAQKTYEALNSLLIEELPTVVEVCRDVVSRCFLNFFVIRKKLCGAIFHELISLSELPLLASGHANIYDSFFTKHKLVCHQMSRLSLLAIKFQDEPANPATPGGQHEATGGTVPRRPSKSPKPSLFPLRQNSTPEPVSRGATAKVSRSSSVVTPGGNVAAVKAKFPADKIFRVERDFPAEKEDTGGLPGSSLPPNFADLLLTARKGDIVGVVKRELPSGGSSHWFVDNGGTQGFLPKDILKPETQRRASATVSPSRPLDTNEPAVNQSHLYDEPPSYEEYMAAAAGSGLPEPPSRYENLDLPGDKKKLPSVKTAQQPPEPRKRANIGEKGKEVVTAMYDYNADTEVELSVHAGDLLVVVSRGDNAGNKDWLYVERAECGKRGYVPASFVAPSVGSEPAKH